MKLDQIIRDIAAGDAQAVPILFDAVSAPLFGLQLRILKDRDLAEFALQDTFYSVWQNASTYDSQHVGPRTWLNNIARMHALDMLRDLEIKDKSDTSMTDTYQSIGLVNNAASVIDPEEWRQTALDYTDDPEEFEGLLRCFQSLSPDSQACIVGLYCDGYTLEDAGQVFRRPIVSISGLVRECLASLQGCLKNEH